MMSSVPGVCMAVMVRVLPDDVPGSDEPAPDGLVEPGKGVGGRRGVHLEVGVLLSVKNELVLNEELSKKEVLVHLVIADGHCPLSVVEVLASEHLLDHVEGAGLSLHQL